MDTIAALFILMSAPSISDFDIEVNAIEVATIHTLEICEILADMGNVKNEAHYWCEAK